MELNPGDYVEVRKSGTVYRGVVMPRPPSYEKGLVTLKLDNGYNIGISIKDADIKVLSHVELAGKKEPAEEVINGHSDKLPVITLIGTGGTIASHVDYKTGAVHPALSASDMVSEIPEILERCSIRTVPLYNILSENMNPQRWLELSRKVRDVLKDSDGVVIPHGTDTMHYTGAALAFMFESLSGPVVLVGAQRSSDRPSTDAHMNLLSAIDVARSDLGEVAVVMHATPSDEYCAVHRAVRVRKMHTSRRDAFQSVNEKHIGMSKDGCVELGEYRKRSDETVLLDKLDDNVGILYFHPGIDVSFVEDYVSKKSGVIVMGTGLGHVNEELIPVFASAIRDGTVIGMTSQCIYGSVNMDVYSTGRALLKAGVIPLGDVLPEVAYVKLMWLLANHPHDEVPLLMRKNLRGELGERRRYP